MTERSATVQLGTIRVTKRHMAALLEVDVTRARCGLRVAKRGGGSTVSFLAWLVKNVASSMARYPATGRGRSQVDVSIMMERQIDGRRVVLPVLIANASGRAVEEIEAQIVLARREPVSGALVLFGRHESTFGWMYRLLPPFVRRMLLDRRLASPRRTPAAMGNVLITSVGMGGRIKGWFIPKIMHPLCIGIGAVTPKAVVMNGGIEPRQMLHLTVLADQSIVDGAPGSRWISSLVRAMENGAELSIN
jgi:hypothetical protein